MDAGAPVEGDATAEEDAGKPLPHAELVFADVTREVAARCDVEPKGTSVGAQRDALQASLACRKAALKEAWTAAVNAAAGDDEKRKKALVRHDAAFGIYVEAACWLGEESFFTNYDAGTRGDDTSRWVPSLVCKNNALSERLFFARALAAGDATAMAAWVHETEARGAAVRARLARMRAQVEELRARAPAEGDAGRDDAGARRLGGNDPAAQKQKLARVEWAPIALAKETCELWPELAAKVEGGACKEKLAAYYFAHVTYGKY